MNRKLKYLEDIKMSINNINSFFEGKDKKFQDYKNNLMLKHAVERNIGIIGEAVTQLRQIDENIEITSASKISGTRNRIIHNYDAVSDDIMWGIIINHLPLLNTEVKYLIDRENIIDRIIESKHPEEFSINGSETIETNGKKTGVIIHASFNGKKKTFVWDKQTDDICYCEGDSKPGSFHKNIPWKTLDGKPAGYTPTRVLSVENKKKLGLP